MAFECAFSNGGPGAGTGKFKGKARRDPDGGRRGFGCGGATGQGQNTSGLKPEPSPGFLLVHDPKWTEEVFFNILENAVKYSPDGSKLHISYEALKHMAPCISRMQRPLSLRKNTPGIFRKFYRGRNAGEQEGWGIGLYLARLILEQEQGYVKVEAGVEKGNIFSVFLPLCREEGNVTSQLGTGIFENPPSPIDFLWIGWKRSGF